MGPTAGSVPRGTSHPVMMVRLAEMFHWTDGGGANSEGGDANTARGATLSTGMWDLSARQPADGPLSHVARAASATDPGFGVPPFEHPPALCALLGRLAHGPLLEETPAPEEYNE